MESKTLSIKKSRNGKGVFTGKNLKKGGLVSIIKGTLITCNEDDDLDEQIRSNTIRFNQDKFLNPKGGVGELFNHSCKPNSKIVKASNRMFIVAIEDLPKNCEVVFDYSTVLADDDIWTMECNCGEKNCRKIIRKFSSLPKQLKEHYIENNIVPKYIINI